MGSSANDLWGDQTGFVVQSSIADAKSRSDAERKLEIANIREFIEGNQLLYLQKFATESLADFKKRRNRMCSINLTDHILTQRALVFKSQPVYSIDDGTAPAQAIKAVLAVLNDPMFTQQLIHADKLTDAYGNMLACVQWEEDESELCVEWFDPDDATVEQNPMNPRKAEAITFDTYNSNTAGKAVKVETRYTKDAIEVKVDGSVHVTEENPDSLNPYGVIPIVTTRNQVHAKSFWQIGSGQRLVELNHAVNQILSDLMEIAHYQAFSVFIITGQPLETPAIGPRAVITLSDTASARFETPNPQTDKLLAILETQIKLAYSTFGLKSANPMRIDVAPESGTAILLNKADALEYRETQAVMWRHWLDRIIRMMLKVWCVHNGFTTYDPKTAIITVDIPKPTLPVPMSERIEEWRFKMEANAMNVVDLFLIDNQGWTREEAIKELVSKATEKSTIKLQSTKADIESSRQSPLAMIMPPLPLPE